MDQKYQGDQETLRAFNYLKTLESFPMLPEEVRQSSQVVRSFLQNMLRVMAKDHLPEAELERADALRAGILTELFPRSPGCGTILDDHRS